MHILQAPCCVKCQELVETAIWPDFHGSKPEEPRQRKIRRQNPKIHPQDVSKEVVKLSNGSTHLEGPTKD